MKGAGESIRYLLGYLGQEYTEYNPESREAWAEKKKTLDVDFPNLPYLKDGDFYLSESSAIPLYLARKAGRSDLFGKDGKDEAIVRQIQGVLGDIRENLWKILQGQITLEAAFAPESSNSLKMGYLSKFLGDKDYFLGYLTFADIELTYFSHFMAVYTASTDQTSPFSSYTNLAGVVRRVSSLPGIKERIISSGDIPFVPSSFLKFNLLTWNQTLTKQTP